MFELWIAFIGSFILGLFLLVAGPGLQGLVPGTIFSIAGIAGVGGLLEKKKPSW